MMTTKCPRCGGYADNEHDREYPPNVYVCSKCESPMTERDEALKVLDADYMTIKNDDGTYSFDYVCFTNAVALHIDTYRAALQSPDNQLAAYKLGFKNGYIKAIKDALGDAKFIAETAIKAAEGVENDSKR